MEPPYPLETLRKSTGTESIAVVVHQMDVMMVLSPIVAHENPHRAPFDPIAYEPENPRRRTNGTVL
jgi:hypothetical protein